MEQPKQQEQHAAESKSWYDKWYKVMLFIPVVVVLLSLAYLWVFFSQHGDIMNRDVTLSGGTTITLLGNVDTLKLESELSRKYNDIVFRKLTDIRTNEQIAFAIESSATPEQMKPDIEKIIGYKLNEENSSVEFTGSSLSENFYRQLIFALIISFILMSIVIVVMFRTLVPSIAVIFAAFSDIVIPLALLDYFGVKISAAGIAAFLMLIGYSVDTDVLLTARVLKRQEGNLNQRIYRAFKTGITMTLTSLAVVVPAFFFVTGLPDSFRQIFLILAIGLAADIFNTWLTNAGVIKWYAERKGMK